MKAESNESLDLLSVFLTGIPGLEAQHGCLSIPFFTMYTVAIVGNSLIITAVQADHALHEPMYLFLSMLAVAEVGVSVSTLPTVLGILWLDACRIDFDGCLAQMFFIHTFSCMESGVLLAMSYDRFVAILQSTVLHSHPHPALYCLHWSGHYTKECDTHGSPSSPLEVTALLPH